MNAQLCPICFNTADPCPICTDPNRNKSTILVVERPSDIQAFEQTGRYKGVYHVLHGLISPRDGIGPAQLKIHELVKRIQDDKVKKLILGIMPTMQGNATIMSIQQELRLAKLTDIKVETLHTGKANN